MQLSPYQLGSKRKIICHARAQCCTKAFTRLLDCWWVRSRKAVGCMTLRPTLEQHREKQMRIGCSIILLISESTGSQNCLSSLQTIKMKDIITRWTSGGMYSVNEWIPLNMILEEVLGLHKTSTIPWSVKIA